MPSASQGMHRPPEDWGACSQLPEGTISSLQAGSRTPVVSATSGDLAAPSSVWFMVVNVNTTLASPALK